MRETSKQQKTTSGEMAVSQEVVWYFLDKRSPSRLIRSASGLLFRDRFFHFADKVRALAAGR